MLRRHDDEIKDLEKQCKELSSELVEQREEINQLRTALAMTESNKKE